MTPYGIIISHETFEFFRYKHKPLGECVYHENTSVSWDINGIPLEIDRQAVLDLPKWSDYRRCSKN